MDIQKRVKSIGEYLGCNSEELWSEMSKLIEEVRKQERQELLNSFIHMTDFIYEWLNLNYPAKVFTGESGDAGAVFVSKLRKLLEELDSDKYQPKDSMIPITDQGTEIQDMQKKLTEDATNLTMLDEDII